MRKDVKIASAVLALVIVAIALTYTTYAALSTNKNLNTLITVKVAADLGVYQDSACTIPLTSIDWGSATPGTAITITIYVKNTGQGTSMALNMTASNWNPPNANGPIAVTWSLEGTKLQPGQLATGVLTATVSPAIAGIKNFYVQISITGTQ